MDIVYTSLGWVVYQVKLAGICSDSPNACAFGAGDILRKSTISVATDSHD